MHEQIVRAHFDVLLALIVAIAASALIVGFFLICGEERS